MKIDRDIVLLEKSLGKSDFVYARKIVENNLKKFSSASVAAKVSMDTLAFINSILMLNSEDNKDLYSRETQLIVQYINKLAHDGHLTQLKRYTELNRDFLSNPKVYAILSADAKIFVPKPEVHSEV